MIRTFQVRPDGGFAILENGLIISDVDPHNAFCLAAAIIGVNANAHAAALSAPDPLADSPLVIAHR